MEILSWFQSCSEKERQAARDLILNGTQQAAAGYEYLDDRFPGFAAIGEHSRTKEAYGHYYTLAFTIMGLVGANMYFPQSKRQSTTKAISGELETWSKGAYKTDGLQLMNKLNTASESVETTLGGWLIGQIAQGIRDQKYKATIEALNQDEQLLTALGNRIITQSAEAVVDCFLEDKSKHS